MADYEMSVRLASLYKYCQTSETGIEPVAGAAESCTAKQNDRLVTKHVHIIVQKDISKA